MPPKRQTNRAPDKSLSRGPNKGSVTAPARARNQGSEPQTRRLDKEQRHEQPTSATQGESSGRGTTESQQISPESVQQAPSASASRRYNLRSRGEEPKKDLPEPLKKQRGKKNHRQEEIPTVKQIQRRLQGPAVEADEVRPNPTRAWIEDNAERVSPEVIIEKPTKDLVVILANYYKDRGYEPPEDESMASTKDTSLAPSDAPSKSRDDRSEKTVKIKAPPRLKTSDPKFDDALQDRNIDTELSPDPNMSSIKELILEDSDADRRFEPAKDETNWQIDLLKCKDSNEAIFQRTIMIDLVNRHELDRKLDYICEAPWTSTRMPARTPKIEICQPQPDLAVAFRSSLLIPGGSLRNLSQLGELKGHMCPEGSKKGQKDRAFHFFSVEVKGKLGRIGNTEAEFQNLNTASQALHNIYLFMKEAREERKFFEKVRVFSAVATCASFEVRVHRPLRLRKGEHIDSEYPLAFGSDEVVAIGSSYKKAQVSKIIWNILFSYGVNELHPILQNVVKTVFDLRTQEAESRASQASTTGKRAAESVEESFGSQRRKLGDLSVDIE